GHLDATTLMEQLIHWGVPQRTAHEIIGKLVGQALARDCRLSDLAPEDFRAAHDSLDHKVYDVLGVDRAIEAFRSAGSTHPELVAEQVELWRRRLQMDIL